MVKEREKEKRREIENKNWKEIKEWWRKERKKNRDKGQKM